jgi:hypothetical protein
MGKLAHIERRIGAVLAVYDSAHQRFLLLAATIHLLETAAQVLNRLMDQRACARDFLAYRGQLHGHGLTHLLHHRLLAHQRVA